MCHRSGVQRKSHHSILVCHRSGVKSRECQKCGEWGKTGRGKSYPKSSTDRTTDGHELDMARTETAHRLSILSRGTSNDLSGGVVAAASHDGETARLFGIHGWQSLLQVKTAAKRSISSCWMSWRMRIMERFRMQDMLWGLLYTEHGHAIDPSIHPSIDAPLLSISASSKTPGSRS